MALGAKGILDLQLLRYFPCIVYNFSFLKKFQRNATCQLTSTDSNCANFTEILAISCSRFTCSPSHKLMFQLVYRFVHGCCVKRNLKPCLHPSVANNNICKTFCQQSCMLAIEKVLAAYRIIFTGRNTQCYSLCPERTHQPVLQLLNVDTWLFSE